MIIAVGKVRHVLVNYYFQVINFVMQGPI